MLYINNKELNITKEEIFVGPYIKNGIKGYCIHIKLSFINEDNVEGYLNLDVGYEKTKDINNFANREYNGIPYDNDNEDILFEVFDTENFYDTEIETPINIKIKNIKDKKIEVEFEVNDELIKINYKGYLNIIEKDFKERITKYNKNSFMEHYHNFHDSFIEDIKQDENNSLVELIINVWWVGNPINEANEIKEEHKKKLRLLFKDTSYFVENNPYSTNYIDDSSITIVNKDNEEYIHFEMKSEEPDKEPIIYIIAKELEYVELN